MNDMINLPDKYILILYDSYSSLSVDGIDESKLLFVDEFASSSLADIIENIEFLFKVSDSCNNFAFIIINKPDSTFLYKVAI